ncbi:MAG: bifunctional phosphoribosylaminoimidazolecarboxamide formyltransferase/inosine monophosphate cyclohydrolase [Chitinophagaceae bacterium]
MQKTIQSALISVFYKEGLDNIIRLLYKHGITIYSTGGTQSFIESLGVPCIPVENITTYPSILGGRVKTLHPSVFGGILGKRDDEQHMAEMKQYQIPEIDLVIVDLYPFEETVANTSEEKLIIEKIDIGGPSMIRAAAKNHRDLVVIASKNDYQHLEAILEGATASTTMEQRRAFAAKAFDICANYDVAISKYFQSTTEGTAPYFFESITNPAPMRYGENPHQPAVFYGNLKELFNQLNGKELSYNNLVDVDAAIQLIGEFVKASPIHPKEKASPVPAEGGRKESDMVLEESEKEQVSKNPPSEGREPSSSQGRQAIFAIIKHTNVCGVAARATVKEAWDAALAGDPESAFGGVLVCKGTIDKATAEAISEIFFEVLIAPAFDADALDILKSKKNRILLELNQQPAKRDQYKSLLNGVLVQASDEGSFSKWEEAGDRETTAEEKADLEFANIICKHLKSNAIALVKNGQLVGKGCGQTSRVDALRQSLDKAKQFNFDLRGAVLASDAFFPFDDCVKMAHEAGITSFIQPGGSIRDKDSISYCKANGLAMVITGMRHFRH